MHWYELYMNILFIILECLILHPSFVEPQVNNLTLPTIAVFYKGRRTKTQIFALTGISWLKVSSAVGNLSETVSHCHVLMINGYSYLSVFEDFPVQL